MVSLLLSLGACSFDSTGTSAGGASLGDDSTGDDSSPSTTASASASASASGGSAPSTSDPTGSMTSADPTSASGTVSESESETQPTTSPTTDESESMTQTESESATSQGTTSEPTTGEPTTGPPADEPYAPCPSGEGDECPKTDDCFTVTAAGSIIGTWCGELGCENSEDCPVPSTGDVMPECRGTGGDTFCVLDCEGNADGCPTGMVCEQDIYVSTTGEYVDRCMWEN